MRGAQRGRAGAAPANGHHQSDSRNCRAGANRADLARIGLPLCASITRETAAAASPRAAPPMDGDATMAVLFDGPALLLDTATAAAADGAPCPCTVRVCTPRSLPCVAVVEALAGAPPEQPVRRVALHPLSIVAATRDPAWPARLCYAHPIVDFAGGAVAVQQLRLDFATESLADAFLALLPTAPTSARPIDASPPSPSVSDTPPMQSQRPMPLSPPSRPPQRGPAAMDRPGQLAESLSASIAALQIAPPAPAPAVGDLVECLTQPPETPTTAAGSKRWLPARVRRVDHAARTLLVQPVGSGVEQLRWVAWDHVRGAHAAASADPYWLRVAQVVGATAACGTGLIFDADTMLHRCTCTQPAGTHPEQPRRVARILQQLDNDRNMLDRCAILMPREATRAELERAHDATHAGLYGGFELTPASEPVVPANLDRMRCGGLGLSVDTVFNGIATQRAARLASGCVLQLIDAVLDGRVRNGLAVVRPPGHHADAAMAGGFCIFNNAAVGAHHALQRPGVNRVLIVDWDVHHGNGTQNIFYQDPRVLYISLHRHDGGAFYPGTGAIDDLGVVRAAAAVLRGRKPAEMGRSDGRGPATASTSTSPGTAVLRAPAPHRPRRRRAPSAWATRSTWPRSSTSSCRSRAPLPLTWCSSAPASTLPRATHSAATTYRRPPLRI